MLRPGARQHRGICAFAASYDDAMTPDAGVERTVATALGRLRATGRVIVTGPGGVGKSTLVTRLLHELAPDDTIVVAADDFDDVTRVVAQVMDAVVELTLPGEPDEAQLAAALSGRATALVIDGADAIVDDVLAWSERLPASGVGPWVVVASRVNPMLFVSPVVRLGPMSIDRQAGPPFAEQLFRTWFAEAGGRAELLDEAPERLERLLAMSGGIPLAIRVAAATAAAMGPEGAEMAIAVDARSDAVARCTARSVARLTAVEREIFDGFAATAGSVDAAALAAIVGRDRAEIDAALATLVRHNLVGPASDRYNMLPPLMRYAREHAADGGAAMVRRHRAWCVTLSREDDDLSMIRWEPEVRVAIDRALVDEPSTAAELAARLVRSMFAAMRYRVGEQLIASVLAEPAVTEDASSDHHLELLRLAAVGANQGRGTAAALRIVDDALVLAAASSRPDFWTARFANIRADTLWQSGDLEAGLAMAELVVGLASDSGDVKTALDTKRLAALMLHDLGRLREATGLNAEVIAACPDDLGWIARMAESNRAEMVLDAGDRAACAAIARRALDEATRVGDMSEAMWARYSLVLADPVRAAPDFAAAHELAPAQHDYWEYHLAVQVGLATAALVADDPERAITIASDVVVVSEALPMWWMTLLGLLLTGDSALLYRDQPQALIAYRRALVEANARSYLLRTADAIDGLARLMPSGDDRRLALAAAAALREPAGAVRRPRPWLPALDSPRRTSPADVPTSWLRDGRLTDEGVCAILALAEASASTSRSADDPIAQLSPAERRVAELVADGLTNREIAERLVIARRTVETHIVHSFQKLGVRNRTELARLITD